MAGLPWTNNERQPKPRLPQHAPKPGSYSAGPAEPVTNRPDGAARHVDNERAKELIKSVHPDRNRTR